MIFMHWWDPILDWFVSRNGEAARGWGTTLAAIVGGGFAFSAWGRERRRDERKALDDKQEQASQVSAWWPDADDPVVSNASASPVWDVELEFHHVRGPVRGLMDLVLAPPGSTKVDPIPEVKPRVIREGTTTFDPNRPSVKQTMERPSEMIIVLRFTDTRGRRWERDLNGKLILLSEHA